MMRVNQFLGSFRVLGSFSLVGCSYFSVFGLSFPSAVYFGL